MKKFVHLNFMEQVHKYCVRYFIGLDHTDNLSRGHGGNRFHTILFKIYPYVV